MIDLENLPRHPLIEQIVDDLVIRTDATDRSYFRVLTALYFAKVAACMRAVVAAPSEKESIPVNCFAITLAESGFGKGKSVGTLERGLISGFRHRFIEDTFPVLSDFNLAKLANEKAAVSGKTEEEEKGRLESLFREAGPYPFTAKSATASSIAQLRGKLLLASVGAINIQIDEYGNNAGAMGVTEALNVFFELYDMGFTEISMTKNTRDNVRLDDIPGMTPANLLLFGEPTKIFDGATTETAFMQLLSSGYARRCLFAWGETRDDTLPPTPEEVYRRRVAAAKATSNSTLKNHFSLLADPARHNWEMTVPEYVDLKRVAYEILCTERAKAFPSTESIKRTEMRHRAFKALKVAGSLAFVDESAEITEDHLMAAIGIVEESGQALHRMLARDQKHVRLAKYIAEFDGDLTHADLHEALPFYQQGQSAQQQMMRDARAWGYKNHVIIRNRFEDGIEVFTGEALKKTDLEEMIVSYSTHFAYDYNADLVAWNNLHQMTQFDPATLQARDFQWCNHRFDKGHRSDENTIPGFNMVVFDYDGGVPIDMVHDLLQGYRFMTYTTKRHDPAGEHRFRLILPINYVLKLDKKDYASFVENLASWLPAPSSLDRDESPKQRSKKWLSNHKGRHHYGDGELIDCLPFIPRTSRNESFRKEMQSLQSLDNLERWFAQRIAEGNRNDQLFKFTMALVDSGMAFSEAEAALFAFNAKLSNGLAEDELRRTVLVTVAKKIAGKSAA